MDNKRRSYFFSNSTRERGAFTLIELLVFLGIFSLIIVSFITILVEVTDVQTRQSASSEVGQQGGFLLQQIQYYVSTARIVDMTQDLATSTLTLRESTTSWDPTTITLSGGIVYLQQGLSGAPAALTSNRVTVTSLSFTRHFNLNSTSTAYGSDSVSFSFTMSANTTNATQYSQLFQSSATVFAPVGKIGLIQHAIGENNNSSISSVSASYATHNETSSLLIAVLANTGLVTSSISDTMGNSWTQIGSSSQAVPAENIDVFAAVNAKNGSNTVTASLGSSGTTGQPGYAELFIYEYRGASTSSSFDASSSQFQPSNQTPSSGGANATSAVELLLGVNYNPNTTEVPAAGPGYTFETSSTANNVTQLFVEDQDQYVTGPVAATWQYSVTTPSTTALIFTFK